MLAEDPVLADHRGAAFIRIEVWRPGLQSEEETPLHLPGNVGGVR
jgi:hypothetical protein